jgi:hypothetical protein
VKPNRMTVTKIARLVIVSARPGRRVDPQLDSWLIAFFRRIRDCENVRKNGIVGARGDGGGGAVA